tara:strand:- start:639 stop:962 length:324 start_codon:yes stop_codon:yes gene_type:complete
MRIQSAQPLLAVEPITRSFRNSGISAFATGAIVGDVEPTPALPMRFGVLGALFTAIVASAGTVGLTLLGNAFYDEVPRLIISPPAARALASAGRTSTRRTTRRPRVA